MFLLKTKPSDSGVWTARRYVRAEPDEVLSALTDPAAIAAWAPVRFDVDGLAGSRLRAGSRERVSGSLAGVRTTFEVEVHAAGTESLELVARGPVVFEVSYEFHECEGGTLVDAAVRVSRCGGLGAQLLGAAVAALLNAGALGAALRRIETSLSFPAEAELVAA